MTRLSEDERRAIWDCFSASRRRAEVGELVMRAVEQIVAARVAEVLRDRDYWKMKTFLAEEEAGGLQDALASIEAVLDARDAGDFSPMMPKIRAELRAIWDGMSNTTAGEEVTQ